MQLLTGSGWFKGGRRYFKGTKEIVTCLCVGYHFRLVWWCGFYQRLLVRGNDCVGCAGRWTHKGCDSVDLSRKSSKVLVLSIQVCPSILLYSPNLVSVLKVIQIPIHLIHNVLLYTMSVTQKGINKLYFYLFACVCSVVTLSRVTYARIGNATNLRLMFY